MTYNNKSLYSTLPPADKAGRCPPVETLISDVGSNASPSSAVTDARARLPKNSLRLFASEGDLQRYVEDLLGLYGWIYHHAGDSRRSSAGLPDIVALRAPRVIFAELKSETGRVRGLQKVWLEELDRCTGVETYLWRPRDMDAIDRVLR